MEQDIVKLYYNYKIFKNASFLFLSKNKILKKKLNLCVSSFVFILQNPGIPFMQVGALDRDDRNTPHADLRFRLLDQMPRIPASHMFNIDAISGEVSLTEDGNQHRA